jgi:dihydroflavonol-4-reductase
MRGPVLVTGASGFIALHCIARLLQDGRSVRGTVRSKANREPAIRAALGPDVGDRLELCDADLSSDAGWEAAAAGCQDVLHVASPFPPAQPKHEDDLIKPARDGTLRVLRACAKARVRRVVVTSSMAAVQEGTRPDRPYDERDWSVTDDAIDAYSKSKTLAERAAWDFVAALPEGERFELVAVNPAMVLGPLLDKDGSTSLEVVGKLLRKEVPGVPNLKLAMVDVRDVADAHMLALTKPEAAGKRFCCVAEIAPMHDVARILAERFPQRRIPTRKVPDFVVRIVGLFDETVKLVIPQLGRELAIDTSALRGLGWTPRGVGPMVVDTAESMIALGVA